MRRVMVFNISLDGYFTDANNDMSWAHKNADEEWNKFTSENAAAEECCCSVEKLTTSW